MQYSQTGKERIERASVNEIEEEEQES